MGWICGSHKDAEGKVVQTVIADGEPCAQCNPPYQGVDERGRIVTIKPGTRGKGYTAAEVAEQAKKWVVP